MPSRFDAPQDPTHPDPKRVTPLFPLKDDAYQKLGEFVELEPIILIGFFSLLAVFMRSL
jgi:hypothetical protein